MKEDIRWFLNLTGADGLDMDEAAAAHPLAPPWEDVMGWDSGADLVWSCWSVLEEFMPPERLREATEAIYAATRGHDFDLADGAPANMMGRVAVHHRFLRDGAPKGAAEGDTLTVDAGTAFARTITFQDGLWVQGAA